MKDDSTQSHSPKNRTSLYDMTMGRYQSSFLRNGKTSTQSTSDWFYNEVCRYFEEDKEAQRDLYQEVDILFPR